MWKVEENHLSWGDSSLLEWALDPYVFFPMLPLLSLRPFCSVQVVHRVYFDKTTAKADTLVASLCTTPSMKLELNLLHFPRFLSSVKCEGTTDNIDVVTHCMMNPLWNEFVEWKSIMVSCQWISDFRYFNAEGVPLISFLASISLPEAKPNSAEQPEDLRMVSKLTSEDFVLSFPLAVNESDLLNHPWDSTSMRSEEMWVLHCKMWGCEELITIACCCSWAQSMLKTKFQSQRCWTGTSKSSKELVWMESWWTAGGV